jgi:2-methylcitrate synthase
MSDKQKKAGGLAGVVAGKTAIATVGKEGAGLTYRGYDITDLADKGCFEETAYLLHYGKLPNAAELAAYIQRL